MRKILQSTIIAVLLVGASLQTSAQTANTWTVRTDVSGGPRAYAVGFSIADKGYIGLGTSAANVYENDIWQYDATTNAWTQRANYPGSGRAGCVGFAIADKGYVGMGINASNGYATFYEYNPATNAWTAKANFPGSARFGAFGFGIGSKGYVGTGSNYAGTTAYSNFYEYNPITDTWTARAAYAGGVKVWVSCFSNSTYGYAGLGANTTTLFNTFYRYNPSSDTWTTLTPYPGTVRQRAVGFSIGEDKGYFCGGTNNDLSVYYDHLYEYDVSANSWAAKADYAGGGVEAPAGFGLGAKGYVGTGYLSSGRTDQFYHFTPSSIATSTISGSPFCAGEAVSVTFTLNNNIYSSDNIFTAQLSSASGSFTNPTNIGYLAGTAAGTISATIPINIPAGTGYRIRVVSSSPGIVIGTNNGTNLTITAATTPTVTIATGNATQNICTNGSVSFTATATNAGTTPVYQWYKNGLAVGSNSATYTNTAWVNGDVVNCKVSSSATCALPAAAFSNNITITTQNTNPDTWVQKADLGTDANIQAPLARSGAASFSIGSKAYMGTGFDGTNYLNDFWEYDPATNVWTQRATYTGGVRTDAVGFSVDGFGYIGTGYNGSAYLGTFRKYDPATNSWASAATLSGIRAGASAFVVGSKAYVGTGYNGSTYLTSFREYDPATNVWTLLTAFPVASAYAGAFSIGTKGYIGDGYNGTAPINTFYEYNPASNAWTAKANIPVARQKVVGFGIGSKGYIGTGLNSAGSLSNVVYEYDPTANTWTTKAAIPTSRSGAFACVLNGKGYVGTGAISGGYTTTLREYDPVANAWATKASLRAIVDRGRYRAVAFSIGDKGYIGTGYNGTSYLNDFWEYDPATNAWTQRANFGGSARQAAVGFNIGGKGYIGTGYDGGYKNDFWEYDPIANIWTQKANFGGTARVDATCFSIGGKGYIGTGQDGALKSDFWEYNPTDNTWAQKANFGGTARLRATSFSIGSKGYTGTGFDGSLTFKNDFWEYDPLSNIWTQKANFGGTEREGAVGFNIGSKGYIGTGNGSYNNDFWEYDPMANAWMQKANFGGTARWAASGFSIGTKGYVGTGNDGSYKQDLWEYTPDNGVYTITTGAVGTTLCAGGAISVPFTVNPTLSECATNMLFYAELSDATGDFTNATQLLPWGTSPLQATIPANTPAGTGYRIRVATGIYPFGMVDNGADIEITTVCPTPFITKWNLATAGSGATQLSFGVGTTGTVNYTWQEVSPGTATGSGTFSGSTATITGLPSGSVIRLIIQPTNFNRININNGTDRNRLVDVEQWGSVAWASMQTAFYGCGYLNITATDVPTLSGVTNMQSMFNGCSILNSPANIGSWNTAAVTNMSGMFLGANTFNQSIGNWNTAAVTNMSSMFSWASAFNQNIGGWNTAAVTNMQQMFYYASSFNQSIGNWHTGAVTNMAYMFQDASVFNQNIGSWNTAAVTTMPQMFHNAIAFNQNIGGWNTEGVTYMVGMFASATAFNQNLGNWQLNSSVEMSSVFSNCGMDCANYSATLKGWAANPLTPNGRSLGANGRQYGGADAVTARNVLLTKLWTITGDAAVSGTAWYLDEDNDNYYTGSAVTQCASPGAGYKSTGLLGLDCNDSDPTKYPGAPCNDGSLCTSSDQLDINCNCSGTPIVCNDNNPFTQDWCNPSTGCMHTCITWYLDADNDGYYVNTQISCYNLGAGWSSTLPSGGSGDCDDADNTVWQSVQRYVDSDGDGFGTGSLVTVCYGNSIPAGYSTNNTDCAPADNTKWQNLNGYVDADNDGYTVGSLVSVCSGASLPSGYVATSLGSDCDDNNAAINPAAADNNCNGIDENCSGTADENYTPVGCVICSGGNLISTATTWYLDADNDGYYTATQSACSSPGAGWTQTVTASGDCAPADNTKWQNLSGYVDADNDGYTVGSLVSVCSGASLPSGYKATSLGSDCDDNNATINPAAADNNCNGIDENCSGTADENYTPVGCVVCSGGNLISTATTWYLDADADGYYTSTQSACSSPGAGWKSTLPIGGSGDCNDNNASIKPGATDICGNGIDEDCSGADLPCSGYTWKGGDPGNEKEWGKPANWVNNSVPNSCAANVTVPVTLHQPQITSGTFSVGNIAFANGTSLTLFNSNSALQVCGNVTTGSGAGTGIGGLGKLLFASGTAGHQIAGNLSVDVLQLDDNFGAGFVAGGSLNVNGILELKKGTFTTTGGTLRFTSTSVSACGIIDNFSPTFTGTISGTIAAERFYAAATDFRLHNQHFFGSPIDAVPVTQFAPAKGVNGVAVTPTPDCDETKTASNGNYGNVFEWEEDLVGSCYLEGWKVRSSGATENARGYSVVKLGSGTLTLTGEPNLDPYYEVSGLTNTSSGQTFSKQGNPFNFGWSLVSNPYLAPIDLDDASNTDFDDNVLVLRTHGMFPGTFQPLSMAGSGLLAPFQGFLARKSTVGGTATFKINATDRRVANATFHKSTDHQMNLMVVGNGYADITYLNFNPNSTEQYDSKFDALKAASSTGQPTLFTYILGNWSSINSNPDVITTPSIRMGFKPGKNGTFMFQGEGFADVPNTTVYLEDLRDNVMQNLTTIPDYTFTSDINDATDRFILHFRFEAPSGLTDKGNQQSEIRMYPNPASGMLFLETDIKEDVKVEVIDINGKVVIATEMFRNKTIDVSMLASAIYQVRITSSQGSVVKRLVKE